MKIAVDTNILVRLVTHDDAELFRKVSKLVTKHSTKEIFVSYGTILELSYVLFKCYEWSKEDVADAVEQVLNADEFLVEHEMPLRLALAKFRKGFTFFDSAIGEVGAIKNLKTYTLDKKLKKNASFVVI